MEFAKEIEEILNSENFIAVGGVVRDYILSLPTKDIDLIYCADISSLRSKLCSSFSLVNVKDNPNYLSISFSYRGFDFTITNARKDFYNPFHCERATLEEDANRRDFTINTIMFDINKHKYIDYLSGMRDLRNGIIRRVASFEDDPSRVVRAIRFRAILNFDFSDSMRKEVEEALQTLDLNNYRVRKEIRKMEELGLSTNLKEYV